VSFIAGVDGCRAGWLCIWKDIETGKTSHQVFPYAHDLIHQNPMPSVIAVDIPIGLTDAGKRECDYQARRLLGQPRSSSVFPAPIRPALAAKFREEASRITSAADGRGVGVQSWAIVPKIKEVDTELIERPRLQDIVNEVHPELSFWAWNGRKPMSMAKKKPEGKAQRRRLVDTHFGSDAFQSIRSEHYKKEVADDDINDAFAALWTAERIMKGEAQRIPDPPGIDSCGLRMEMWY
jgi:predicted RNase H-like nuclease